MPYSMIYILNLFISFSLFLPVSLYGDILRCNGSIKWPEQGWGQVGIEIKLDILVPEENEDSFSLGFFSEKGRFTLFGPKAIEFKKGILEITESLGKGETKATKKVGKYDFIVTQMHSEANSLIGFFIPDGNQVSTLRIDTWKKNMPFYFYSSGNNELMTGICENR